MAMSDVRSAFVGGLGSVGTCTSATMGYLPDVRKQRLTFVVKLAGESHTLTEDVAPSVDLTTKAREMAAAFIASRD